MRRGASQSVRPCSLMLWAWEVCAGNAVASAASAAAAKGQGAFTSASASAAALQVQGE